MATMSDRPAVRRTAVRGYSWTLVYLVLLFGALMAPLNGKSSVARSASGKNVLLSRSADLPRRILVRDIALNVAIFVPLGFALHRALRGARVGPAVRLGTAVLVPLVFSLGIESLQYVLAWRVSSLLDVACNGIGALLGVCLESFLLHVSSPGVAPPAT
jgi:glycopeptide antibiotics resistance protein